jgi:hypothetical protein
MRFFRERRDFAYFSVEREGKRKAKEEKKVDISDSLSNKSRIW